MPQPGTRGAPVVVGNDGAGRTHRLLADAAGRPSLSVDPAQSVDDVRHALRRAGGDGSLVLADDAHRLAEPVLTALADAARAGTAVRISRRPGIDRPELADLDAALAGDGVVELQPLTDPEVATLLARIDGRPVDPDRAEEVRRATAGLPALVAATAAADPVASIRARVAHQLARTADARAATRVVAVLAVTPEAADPVVAEAVGIDRATLAAVLRELREAGLLVPAGDRLVPVVADAVTADLAPAERRETHQRVADAMLAGDDPLAAADQLRAAGARSPRAAVTYAAAADRSRFADPAAAAGWYDLALVTGVEPAAVVAGLAETAVLQGRHPDVDPGPDAVPAETAARIAIARGVAAAQQGRAGRAADALLAAPDPGPVLAVPSLVAVGRIDEARVAAARPAPEPASRLAEAALGLREPGRALPALIEAAECYEAAPDLLLPDTPHAIAAVAAMAAGDTDTAEHLLVRAGALGGPHAALRHRLLLSWVRLRSGRYAEVAAEVAATDAAALPGRERLLVAALTAGLARRSAEASRLREAWTIARPALVRRSVDLLGAEILEELLVAAARLREPGPVAATLADLDAIVARLDDPDAWRRVVDWSRLQVAVATDDPDAAATAAERLAGSAAPEPTSDDTARVLAAAAAAWADALAGRVDGDRVEAAARDLAERSRPWEASRLCGHAAIRTDVAADARRLLERARELTEAGVPAAAAADSSGLSERELEVGRLVLAGETYKAIGARLYLSPKTVEHHVARIKSKLGAADRADLIAALRSLDP